MLTESCYESRTGLRVYRRDFCPSGPVAGAAVFLHGLGDHSGRHHRHLQLFADHGIRCVAFDLPGHGLTEGARGFIESSDLLLDLIDENLAFARSDLPLDAPAGVLGHSMGGFFSLHYMMKRPEAIRFAWISSPLVDPAGKAGWLKRVGGRLLNAVCPGFTLQTGVRSALCKRDPAAIAATKADRLVHRALSVRLGAMLLDCACELHAGLDRIPAHARILVTQGKADRICPPEPSQALFNRLPCARKAYALFDDDLHEPFNDVGKEAFYATLERWIRSDLAFPIAAERAA